MRRNRIINCADHPPPYSKHEFKKPDSVFACCRYIVDVALGRGRIGNRGGIGKYAVFLEVPIPVYHQNRRRGGQRVMWPSTGF